MTPERILAEPPRVLPQQARIDYFEKGFALVEDAVPEVWIDRLLAVTGRMVQASRSEREAGHVFDIAPEHGPDNPRVRRIKRPDEQDEAYWAFVQEVLADIAADLLGPDVVFHHSKLNFKWFEGGDEVQWHQDIQFYPHTNYDHLTIGAYLADTGPENGPMSMLPQSHRGPLYDLYAPDGNWAGHLRAVSDGYRARLFADIFRPVAVFQLICWSSVSIGSPARSRMSMSFQSRLSSAGRSRTILVSLRARRLAA